MPCRIDKVVFTRDAFDDGEYNKKMSPQVLSGDSARLVRANRFPARECVLRTDDEMFSTESAAYDRQGDLA